MLYQIPEEFALRENTSNDCDFWDFFIFSEGDSFATMRFWKTTLGEVPALYAYNNVIFVNLHICTFASISRCARTTTTAKT